MSLTSELGRPNWTKGSLFELPEFDGHEEVSFFGDDSVALRAILAIHSTTLGPALGGCRMLPYPSSTDAVGDVLRNLADARVVTVLSYRSDAVHADDPTLAFLALSVIPSLKITDHGLVDVDRFELVPLRA